MKKIFFFIGAGILLGGGLVYGVVSYMAAQRIKGEVAEFVEQSPAVEQISYDAVRVGVIRPTAHFKNIRIKLARYQAPIQVDHLDLDVRQQEHGTPLKARMEINGLHLNVHHGLLGAALGRQLEAMGYNDVTVKGALAYAYDPAGKRLDLDDLTLQAEKIGRLQLTLSLANVDLADLAAKGKQANVIALIVGLPTMKIVRGRVVYRDDSFMRRLDRLKPSPVGQGRRILARALAEERNEGNRRNIKVMQSFMDHPKSIAASLEPGEPVQLLRFLWVKKPMDIFELLNVTLTI